jgi:Na+/H+ antiporter NhaD/arsenite permease-like protein
VLDNLTATIVMVSLARKLLKEPSDRLLFAALIVIAANAGGAWSPIGDVTTTMLWIGGQITTLAIIKGLFIPSVVNLLAPLLVISYSMRGKSISAPSDALKTSNTSLLDADAFTSIYGHSVWLRHPLADWRLNAFQKRRN